jgi:hypothetical protein
MRFSWRNYFACFICSVFEPLLCSDVTLEDVDYDLALLKCPEVSQFTPLAALSGFLI